MVDRNIYDPRWNRVDQDRRFRRLVIWTHDNKEHLPKDYISALFSRYSHNIGLVKAHIYGEFCSLSGKSACPSFSIENCVIDSPPDTYSNIIFGLDFNVEPLAWVALQEKYLETATNRHRKLVVVVGEGSGNASYAAEAATEFAYKFSKDRFGQLEISIDGDSQGHRRNPLAPGTPFGIIKDVLKRQFVSVKITAAEYNPMEGDTLDVMDMAFGDGWLKIHKDCANTIRSCAGVELQEGQRKLKKDAGENVTHWFDGLKYPVFRIAQERGLNPNKPRISY